MDFVELPAFSQNPDVGHTVASLAAQQPPEIKAGPAANAGDAGHNSGFTAFVPSPDSRVIYVSSSSGKDSNTCLSASAPCQTLYAAISKMRAGKPDHVYLKRGDTWRGESISRVQSGRSTAEPSVIAFFGEQGPRPRIESDQPVFKVNGKYAKQNVQIIGLHFYAYRKDPANPAFTNGGSEFDAGISLLGNNENLLFEDNVFDLLEVKIQQWDGGTPRNFRFRRNIWTGAYYNSSSYDRKSRPSNLFAHGVDGLLLEGNVMDHGGWNRYVRGAGANMYNHNVYIQYTCPGPGITVRQNIITRSSSHGLQIRSGGVVEDNFFAENAIGISIGYTNHPMKNDAFARVNDNVITEGHSMIKGIDACQGKNLCTPAVYGITGNDYGEAAISLANNIVHTLSSQDTQWKSAAYNARFRSLKTAPFGVGAAAQDNNISWQWSFGEKPKTPSSERYANPGRTLADYNQHLAGKHSAADFMNVILTRPLQNWDGRYTAGAINDFIQDGFGL